MPVPITAPQITSVIKWFPEAKRKPAVKDARVKLETTTGIFHGEFEKYLQNKNNIRSTTNQRPRLLLIQSFPFHLLY